MKAHMVQLTLSLLAFLLPIHSYSADISVTARPDRDGYAVGDTARIACIVSIPSSYHLYGNPLGPGIGKPLKISLQGNDGFSVTGMRKSPAEKYKPDIGEWVWAYEKEARFFIEGVIRENAPEEIEGTIIFDGLICHTACVPFTKKVPFVLTINNQVHNAFSAWGPSLKTAFGASRPMEPGTGGTIQKAGTGHRDLDIDLGGLSSGEETGMVQWDYDPVEPRQKYNVVLALVLAFLAGIILNVMPCVLPVLGVKILSFSHGLSESRGKAVLRSLIFAAGMITVFMALASLAAFAGYSWGEQFQNPKMLVGIVSLIFIFALGMFDFYVILVPSNIGSLEQQTGEGLFSDFYKGMFATILATPCSGPLLGATLAWTLTQPTYVIFLVFGSVGAGMAFPYVLLSSSKTLARFIPKPGKWMEDFKHVMGYLLLGFAVFLMIGLPRDMILSTVGLCVFLAMALSFYSRIAPFGSAIPRKITALLVAAGIIGAGIYVNFGVLYSSISDTSLKKAEKQAGVWQEFKPSLLRSAHASGTHVLIDFTANWCMNCQYNKIAVLHSKQIVELIKDKDILALKADITTENPPAESLLHHLGSRSVPFLAVFPGDNPYEPVVMRDLIDKKRLAAELKKLPEK
ncbi:MAG: hypothetical protein GF350_12325 [Chitinivibrionales bacterium]|nr:hypothetical protein [Chitinivibrionales bacterium]